jgi:Ca2+-binding EF-hand superfamily protein
MKIVSLLCIAILLTTHPDALAKGSKDSKGKGKKNKSTRVLAHFDRNHDGSIDAEESERMTSTYDALSSLDTDHDGKLSGSEVAAAKIPLSAKKKAAKK